MKNKKILKIVCIAIAVIVLIYLIALLIKLVKKPTETFAVENGKIYQEEFAEGYIIRDESLINISNLENGIVPIKSEGDKVAKGESIYRYCINNEEEINQKIEEIDLQIQENLGNDDEYFSSDIKLINNQIDAKLDDIYESNNLKKINQEKSDINTYLTKKMKIKADNSNDETLKKLNPNIVGEARDEISDLIAVGALKYADLLPNRSTDYIFDEDKFSDFNGKTGVYLLYSTIRMKSLLMKAKEQNVEIGPINVFVNDFDRNIALKLLETPVVLDKAFKDKSLNEIAEYLYQLINIFNNFYASNHILAQTNDKIKQSWLGLVETVYNTSSELLDVMGIEQPKRM